MRRIVFIPWSLHFVPDLIREKKKKKKRRNKFSAMIDSLFLRSNIVAREEERSFCWKRERGRYFLVHHIPADKSVHFAVPHRVRTVHKQHTASLGCGYLRMYRVCIISADV